MFHFRRFLLRVLPVELSCYASEEEISRAMKPLVEQYFPANSEAPVKVFVLISFTHCAQAVLFIIIAPSCSYDSLNFLQNEVWAFGQFE